MMESIILTIIVAICVVNVRSLHVNNEPPATDLLHTQIGNKQTLPTDVASNEEDRMIFDTKVMLPKPKNEETSDSDLIRLSLLQKANKETFSTILIVINLNAVKNQTAYDLNDVLYNDVIEELPEETEDGEGNIPVSLDEVAKDLEGEGFVVEKVVKDGEIRLIKVNLDLVKTTEEISNKGNTLNDALQQKTKIQECGVVPSIRRKRNACFKCTIMVKKPHKRGYRHGHGGRWKCRGGCGGRGGHYHPQPAQPVYHQIVYQTIYQYPQSYYQQPHYNQQQYYRQPYYNQQQYHPQPQQCNTCHGGYGNSGRTAQAQASAQASASSSSGGYGR